MLKQVWHPRLNGWLLQDRKQVKRHLVTQNGLIEEPAPVPDRADGTREFARADPPRSGPGR
ncbi:hypothetical protein TR51_04405 [Kitasatospora griseola]|uniref:Uncharacterized protein n=1 Tax=Kitasatospora griseola TaxID=2064 RepID=A0A0D0PWC9_KITGR|nr:hypothetical protein TR51_04405 [Kitasatospora griseola]